MSDEKLWEPTEVGEIFVLEVPFGNGVMRQLMKVTEQHGALWKAESCSDSREDMDLDYMPALVKWADYVTE